MGHLEGQFEIRAWKNKDDIGCVIFRSSYYSRAFAKFRHYHYAGYQRIEMTFRSYD